MLLRRMKEAFKRPCVPVQAALRPVLLRRMKEDVEDLPDKEEIVVSVELTPEQRHYYKAIFEKQVGWRVPLAGSP